MVSDILILIQWRSMTVLVKLDTAYTDVMVAVPVITLENEMGTDFLDPEDWYPELEAEFDGIPKLMDNIDAEVETFAKLLAAMPSAQEL